MNYFEFYPGDYLRDTGRLSLAEHGAYMKLLMDYYATEQPLPTDWKELYILTSAITAVEKAAVRKIIERFFTIAEDGLHHNERVDKEIAKAQRRMVASRENGKKGGCPKKHSKNPAGSENTVFSEPKDNPAKTQQPPYSGVHQTPDPIISSSLCSEESLVFAEDGNATGCTEKPKRSPHGSRLPDDWAPSEGDVLYATQQGVDGRYEAEKFRDYWRSVAGAKGRKQDWEATWRNWIRRAAEDKTSSMKHGYQRHEYNSKPMRLSPAERSRVFHRPFDLRDGVLQ
ncbi:YdaU family protein [Xylella fastidiosa]|uniref:YdaU family protein n=1 Tax=Xylella fastidiosa TaxID=2371 RepID=UPI0003D2C871|nr:DUF1376 domain-containing protein [Xylella fastidiosa]ALR04852.1 YdaU family protein [Xylella fastidiosa]OJZ70104.1 hypothetical protein B375_0209290 [Xylella fastidiosa 6c]